MIRILVAVGLGAALAAGCTSVERPAPRPGEHTLWYDSPADLDTGWTSALPVGNGRLGAMVYGGTVTERLQLNEDTVWARSHLEALRTVREFREIRVWSPRNAGAFARRHEVRVAHSAEDAVRGADVIVVATTSRTPILRGEWLSPGVHINAVGAPRPDWRELDDQVLHKATLYVESREAATRESGDVIAAGSIFAEIGEVVGGTKPGRQSEEEVTLFKSVGVAVEDLASAELVYRRALAAQPLLAGDVNSSATTRRPRPQPPPRPPRISR